MIIMTQPSVYSKVILKVPFKKRIYPKYYETNSVLKRFFRLLKKDLFGVFLGLKFITAFWSIGPLK